MTTANENHQNISKSEPATLKDFLAFPCTFDFKIVGKNSIEYFNEMKVILSEYLNIASENIEKKWNIRYSSTKKYATINYAIIAIDENMIYELQKKIQKSAHVITCL